MRNILTEENNEESVCFILTLKIIHFILTIPDAFKIRGTHWVRTMNNQYVDNDARLYSYLT